MALQRITMKYQYITVEGNIGAGKTTLAHLLSKKLNSRLILEEFADNPFLAKFYDNPQQYAFPLELFFMAERYKQLKDMLHTKDMFQHVTVSDYLFTKCLLFAKVNLPEEEFRLYQKLFDIIHQQLIFPDILIYLHAPVQKLQQNIKRRNREYEQAIPDEYLFNIQETYTSYIKQHNIKTIDYAVGDINVENGKTMLSVKRVGKMPMPIDILVTYKDGSQEMHVIALDLMYGTKPAENEIPRTVHAPWRWTHPEYKFPIGKSIPEIKSIEIDPSMRLADINRNNNKLVIPD